MGLMSVLAKNSERAALDFERKGCQLRGTEPVGERECKSCGGTTKYKVFTCPKHPEGVTLMMRTPDGPDCKNCPDPGKL